MGYQKMNRCPVCGTLNEEGLLECKHCNHIFDQNKVEPRPKRLVESLFGVLFLIYGFVTLILNFIHLDSILIEPFMFMLIGAYMIGGSILLGDHNDKVDDLEKKQLELIKRIEDMEKQLKK
jgi:predicted nucleic acid-binding Zn ribbon protein